MKDSGLFWLWKEQERDWFVVGDGFYGSGSDRLEL